MNPACELRPRACVDATHRYRNDATRMVDNLYSPDIEPTRNRRRRWKKQKRITSSVGERDVVILRPNFGLPRPGFTRYYRLDYYTPYVGQFTEYKVPSHLRILTISCTVELN